MCWASEWYCRKLWINSIHKAPTPGRSGLYRHLIKARLWGNQRSWGSHHLIGATKNKQPHNPRQPEQWREQVQNDQEQAAVSHKGSAHEGGTWALQESRWVGEDTLSGRNRRVGTGCVLAKESSLVLVKYGADCPLRNNSQGACSLLWPAEDLGSPCAWQAGSNFILLFASQTLNQCLARAGTWWCWWVVWTCSLIGTMWKIPRGPEAVGNTTLWLRGPDCSSLWPPEPHFSLISGKG